MADLRNWLLCLAMCIQISTVAYAEDTILAAPNHVSTTFFYDSAYRARVGHMIDFKYFEVAGLISVQNTPEFSQSVLPYHSWKGMIMVQKRFTIRADAPADPQNRIPRKVDLLLGFEHESAHGTMGIAEYTHDPHHWIYDGNWRPISLNSFQLGLETQRQSNGRSLIGKAAYHFYVQSKNQPELLEYGVTEGHGLRLGLQFEQTLADDFNFYVSLHHQRIAQANAKLPGFVYVEGTWGVRSNRQEYPILNDTVTTVVQFGFAFTNLVRNHQLGIYTELLVGHPDGFVDSRAKETRAGIGIRFH